MASIRVSIDHITIQWIIAQLEQAVPTMGTTDKLFASKTITQLHNTLQRAGLAPAITTTTTITTSTPESHLHPWDTTHTVSLSLPYSLRQRAHQYALQSHPLRAAMPQGTPDSEFELNNQYPDTNQLCLVNYQLACDALAADASATLTPGSLPLPNQFLSIDIEPIDKRIKLPGAGL